MPAAELHQPARRIRVTRLVPALDFGGVESILAVHAKHYDRSRFDLRICTFWRAGRTANDLKNEGMHVDTLDVDPRVRNPWASLALARYVARQRPDILHASVPEADFHAALVGRFAGARVVLTDEAGLPNRRTIARFAFSLLHRNTDFSVAVSEALRSYLVEREFVRAERVRVIPTCGHTRFFTAPKLDYDVGARPFRFVCVGRLVPEKNQAVAISAIAALRERGVAVELTLCGEGPLEGELRAHAERMGFGESIRFAGFAPDLVAALRDADGYLLPSTSEGCSLSLIEAMAMRLPVMASDIPGNREVLHGYPPRWLVAPTNVQGWSAAMADMVSASASDRATLGRSAGELAARFAPERHVAELERLYVDALNLQRGNARDLVRADTKTGSR